MVNLSYLDGAIPTEAFVAPRWAGLKSDKATAKQPLYPAYGNKPFNAATVSESDIPLGLIGNHSPSQTSPPKGNKKPGQPQGFPQDWPGHT
jgi:hypothetical protein